MRQAGYKEKIEERYKELEEMWVSSMFDGIGELAKRDREKDRLEGEREGKLEERKELIIGILNQRFGEDFDKRLEEKIRKTNEETINQIKKNILSITLEDSIKLDIMPTIFVTWKSP